MNYKVINLYDKIDLINEGATWFSSRWNIAYNYFLDSMRNSFRNKMAIPQWYIITINDKIIAGCGVIDDLSFNPSICYLYVDEEYRNQGIAKILLKYVCEDMSKRRIKTLYLTTSIDNFFERCGWQFFSNNDNGNKIYIHKK